MGVLLFNITIVVMCMRVQLCTNMYVRVYITDRKFLHSILVFHRGYNGISVALLICFEMQLCLERFQKCYNDQEY